MTKPTLAFGLLPLTLIGLLTACGGGGTTTPPVTSPTPTPTEQAGRILGSLRSASLASSMKPNDLNVSAAVGSNARFDLGLPNAATMNSTYSGTYINATDVFGCSAGETQIAQAPAGMKLTPENYLVNEKNARFITQVNSNNASYNFKGWWFSTVSGTLRFKGNCLVTGSVDTTLALQRGWNVINIVTTGSSTTYAVTSQPTNYPLWIQATSAQGLQAQGINPDILTPWKVLPQYQTQ